MKSTKTEAFVIVHNIRSLHNVGSIFRTSDGAGVKKLYLTGYTPSPVDELGKYRKEIQKTALGAEKTVEWEKVKDVSALISKLKLQNIKIIALENTKGAINYLDCKRSKKFALIIGNEVRGLSGAILRKSDVVISIPMRGKKESLNVSIAFGIAIYSLF